MYKKILVPIDFSRESANAVDTAVTLAKAEGSEMMLLNVIEDPYTAAFRTVGGVSHDPKTNAFVIELKKRIEEKLNGLVENLKRTGLKVSYKIQIGNVFATISEQIDKVKADLIIMGSKGASGISEVLVGSTTEKVVKYVHCPVITVKEKVDLTRIKSIVYPTDLKEEQEKALNDIKVLQKKHNAHLHLLKVYDSDFVSRKEVEARTKKFAEYFKLEDYSITVLKHPDEAEAILQFAEQIDATMIAMATHYRRGMEVLFNTRISKNVLNRAKRPIWTKRVN